MTDITQARLERAREIADDLPDDDFDTGLDGCWQCCGEGFVSDCFDGFCIDAESGCDLCTKECDVCGPKARARDAARVATAKVTA